MPDFGATELDAFRAEARDWLEANYPASLREHPEQVTEAMNGGGKPTGDAEVWRQRMGEKGWGVPTWPKQYGGGGLTPAEARVLYEEMGKIGAVNPIGGMGVIMFGPTLLEYGTEAQLQEQSRESRAARSAGARAIPSPAPAPTSPRCRPRPRTKATTG
jgi:alkylation response protein AidB-like acyl-CoA dehydrogenase